MAIVLVTALSILALAGLAWAAAKALRLAVCPVCIGVAGTWLWMLAARFAGMAIDTAMLAILLGGSVVGAAYQLERRLPQERAPLAWKISFLSVGFAAAYGIASAHWALAAIAGVALVALAAWCYVPQRPAGASHDAIEKLVEKMKKCC